MTTKRRERAQHWAGTILETAGADYDKMKGKYKPQNDRGRNKCVQNIGTQNCKENMWMSKRRKMENMNKQGDKGHTTRGRYCKIYNNPLINIVWSCKKNAKTKCNSYNGRNKERRKTT
jgi:hypothetical protein